MDKRGTIGESPRGHTSGRRPLGKVAAAVRAQLSEATWNTWFQGVHALDLTTTSSCSGCPARSTVERIRSSYCGLLTDAVQRSTGGAARDRAARRHRRPVHDEPVTLDADDVRRRRDRRRGRRTGAVAEPECGRAAGRPSLNPRYTFDQFVIGASNRFAHAAALSVAESPAAVLQPAVHLRARRAGQDPPAARIGHHVRERLPQQAGPLRLDRDVHERVRRRDPRPRRMPGSSAATATSTCCSSTTSSSSSAPRSSRRSSSTRSTSSTARGGQIVISSDRPPKSIATPRGPAAQPLRVGPHHRRPAARVRDPPRHPPQEGRVRAPRRHPRRGARLHRHQHQRQHPRARGRPDPGRGLLEPPPRPALRGGRPARCSPTSCRRPSPGSITPGADPRRDRQDVRLDRRRPLRQEPAPAARHRPPDRHVRVPGAHRLQLPADRRGVRRPRPHDRHARRARRSSSR